MSEETIDKGRRFAGLATAAGFAALLGNKAEAQPIVASAGNATLVTSSGTPTARSLTTRFADAINVKDYGAVLNGITSDSAAFQAAYNAAPSNGTINIPIGGLNANFTETPTTKNIHWNLLGTLDFGTYPAGTNPVFGLGDGDLLTGYWGGTYNFVKNIVTSTNGYANVQISVGNKSTGNQFAVGTVISALQVEGSSVASGAGWTWPLVVTLNAGLQNASYNNAQEVATASMVNRYGNGVTWNYFGAQTDYTGLTGSNGSHMVFAECDMNCNGPEPASTVYNAGGGARTFYNYSPNVYTPPVWTSGTTYVVGPNIPNVQTGIITASPTNGYVYTCIVSGISGSSQPTWPVTSGSTVTDGTATWQYTTTIATQISRAINIGGPSNAQFAAGLYASATFYGAAIDISNCVLSGTYAVGLRMSANMPIDLSANGTLAGLNLNTLRYDSTNNRIAYAASGTDVFTVNRSGTATFAGGIDVSGVDSGNVALRFSGTGAIAVDTSNFTSSLNAIRLFGGQTIAFESTSVETLSWTGGNFVFATAGTANLSINNSTVTAANSITITASGPTLTTGSGVPAATTPAGSIYMRTSGSTGSRLYISAGGGTWNAVSGV